MPRQRQTTRTWQAPIQGLNTETPAELLPDSQSPDLVNVYHEDGFLKKALGFAKNTTTALQFVATDAKILKIYEFENAAGTKRRVAEAYDSQGTPEKHVVYHDGTDWNTNTIKSGLDATADINFATFGDYLVFGNGVDENYVWDGSLSGGVPQDVSWLGIDVPANALAAPAEVGGNIADGTYFYAYRYESTTTGFISNLKTGFSHNYSGGPTQGTFSAPVDSSDAEENVDNWRLYRTVVGGIENGPYFEVGTAAVASNIVDNLADASLGAQAERDYDRLPSCNIFHVWRKRLWAAGDTSNKSTIYFSKIDSVYRFPQGVGDTLGAINTDNVDIDDGDVVTGIGDLGNMLVVTKEESMHPYLHTGIGSFQRLQTIRNNGCLNHRSIVQANGGLWMADRRGVWFFDGQASIRLSARVDSIFDNMSAGGKSKLHAVWYRPLNFYVLFYQQAASVDTDAALIIDTRAQRPRADRVGIFRMATLKAAGSGLMTDSNDEPEVWIGADEGHSYLLFKAATYSFDTAKYSARFKTKQHQLHPHWIYRMREGALTAMSDGEWDLTVNWSLDFNRRVGGSVPVSLAPIGVTVDWIAGGVAMDWDLTNPATPAAMDWQFSQAQITDSIYQMEGESNVVQFELSNGNAGESFAISKIGLRAQLKKVA